MVAELARQQSICDYSTRTLVGWLDYDTFLGEMLFKKITSSIVDILTLAWYLKKKKLAYPAINLLSYVSLGYSV